MQRGRRSIYRLFMAIAALAVLLVIVWWPARLAETRASEDPPETIELTGIVRDFHRAHPDFDVAGGSAHFAGVADPWLSPYRRPVLSDAGFRVQSQWRDRDGRAIAPHIASVIGSTGGEEVVGLRVAEKVEVKNDCVIDAFSSSRGEYGVHGNYGFGASVSLNSTAHDRLKLSHKARIWGNAMIGPDGDVNEVIDHPNRIVGSITVMDEVYPMPVLEMPGDGPVSTEHVHLEGVVTWGADEMETFLHYGDLHVQHDTSITVHGDVVIRCDHDFKLDRTTVHLAPDASLTVYVGHKAEFKDRSLIAVDSDSTTSFVLNYLGTDVVKCDKSHVYATVIAPAGRLEVKDYGHLYGSFIGREIKIEDKSAFHVDGDSALPATWNFAVTANEEIKIEDTSSVDGFDSLEGPYDAVANGGDPGLLMTNTFKSDKVELKNDSVVIADILVGAEADVSKVLKIDDHAEHIGVAGNLGAPTPIPFITPPLMGDYVEEVKHDGGTHVLAENLHCKKLKLEHEATLRIEGDIVIRCDENVELKEGSGITLAPGSSLTLYVRHDLKVEKDSFINMPDGDPKRVSVRMMSFGKQGKVEIKERSSVAAWIQGARSELKIEHESVFAGTFTGRKVKVKDDSKLHVDMAYLEFCLDVVDAAGDRGSEGNGGVTSADTFDQWFRDVVGVNQMKTHAIVLERQANGHYLFDTESFYPVDNRLFGNEGDPHNRFFTYAIRADFTYQDCGGQFIDLEGGDGLWAFVNDRLVIDLGGVRPPGRQIIELDRLGLIDGQPCKLDLFVAQRQSSDSILRIETNVELSTKGVVPGSTEQYD